MKTLLSRTDLGIWTALIVSKLILCFCILRKHFFRRLPGFSIYLFASAAKSLLLVVVAFTGSYAAYRYSFFVSSRAVSALAVLTLIECGRQILPGLKLPQGGRALAWLAVGLATVVVFAISFPLSSLDDRIEVGASLGIAVAFIFIAAYSRYLGLYWSRLLAGMTATLGLLYLVEGAIKAVMTHYPPALVLQVREISQVASILAVIAWIVIILSPWGEYRLTPDQLRALKRNVDEIEANLRDFAEEAEKVA